MDLTVFQVNGCEEMMKQRGCEKQAERRLLMILQKVG